MDRGFEYYAPQSFSHPDGRILSMGWMGTMEREKEEALPTIEDNWAHHLSIIRELSLSPEGRLIQKPARELDQARVPLLKKSMNEYKGDIREPYEVKLDFKEQSRKLKLNYGNELSIDFDGSVFRVERTDWLTKEREYRSDELPSGLKDLQIIVDRTSAEVFINGGREVFSLRFFKEEGSDLLEILSEQEMVLEISQLK